MDIKLGWSSEVGGTWSKFDIGLDEEDIKSLFLEENVSLSKFDLMTVNEKYSILTLTAEKFTLVNQMMKHPEYFSTEENKNLLKEKTSSIHRILQAIKERVR